LPSDIKLDRPLNIIPAISEMELLAAFEAMAANNSAARRPSFLGAGAYAHYSPTIVYHLIQRSEFFTAYTPYQPEVSQGTLQVIFEFQTIVSEILGLPVAHASMYDGASAEAEAVLMARRLTGREHTVISEGVHPHYAGTIETYVAGI